MKTKFQIQELLGIGLTLVVLGIGIAYGLQVMGDVKTDVGESSCANRLDGNTTFNESSQRCSGTLGNANVDPGTEFTATGNAIEGTAKLPEKIPTIATVVVAAVIIGILVTYLWGRFQ